MNTHLNLYRTYAKETRQYQLENDLTRALAICMEEDCFFFNNILNAILDAKYLNEFFNDLDSTNSISIHIQKSSSEIDGFEKIFAVSLSELETTPDHFWNQKHETKYDPICDIVVKINGVLIIIEAKRDNVDCTSQLYNQIFNICNKNQISSQVMKEIVVPVDLNWRKLMGISTKVHSFEKATGSPNRFLKDFIELVKTHNFRWFTEPSIFSVSPDNKIAILRRIESAINELNKGQKYKKLDRTDRLGLFFDKSWANEILFKVNENGDLIATIYPGNTKLQGGYIFNNELVSKSCLQFDGKKYNVSVTYHIKFTSFQKYFTGLWFGENELKNVLYTKENFLRYCGRKKRENDWESILVLFDNAFQTHFDWKKQCDWESKIILSGRNQFDMSFGYELSVVIPFNELKVIDQNKEELLGLTTLIDNIYNEFGTVYNASPILA